MRAGQLRHQVAVQSRTLTSDGMGGQTESWETKYTVYAGIWPVSARERVQAGQMETTITHRLRLRYQAGITTAMRVVFDGRTFEIVSIINPDERNISLDLLCTEVESV